MSLPQWIQNGCPPLEPDYASPYDYVPWLSAGIVFIALFSVSGLIHIGQSVYTRQWWGFVSSAMDDNLFIWQFRS